MKFITTSAVLISLIAASAAQSSNHNAAEEDRQLQGLWEAWICDYFPHEWHHLPDELPTYGYALQMCKTNCGPDVTCTTF